VNTTHVDVDGYVAGALDKTETRRVEEHLAECADCREDVASLREMQEFLGELPPEIALDGRPEDADLVLQRTLRQAHTEADRARRRRGLLTTAAAVVVAAGVLAAGFVIGRSGEDTPVAAPTPTQAAGTKFASATDPATGASITVAVAPAPGWVRLNAAVTGIPQGERCRLVVVSKNGSETLAGSWLVSEKGAGEGTTLDGSALVDPADVATVRVENTDGKTFTSVSL
jgi:hypothetical protein